MGTEFCKMIDIIDEEQKKMKKDIVLIEEDIQEMKMKFWEGFVPFCVLIGTYTLISYNSKSSPDHPIIIESLSDYPKNLTEFRR